MPWGQFATSDGWIVLIVSADRVPPGMARLLDGMDGRPEFGTTAGRRHGRADIYAAVRRWAAFCHRSRRWRSCAQPISRRSGWPRHPQMSPVDPHLRAREMFAALPGTAGKPVLGAAMRFRSAASQPAAGAPALGEHTWRVLADIGVGAGEAAALAAPAAPRPAPAPAPRPKPAARPARLARIREES